MEYGASCEDIARVCHAHPVSANIKYTLDSLSPRIRDKDITLIFIVFFFRPYQRLSEKPISPHGVERLLTMFKDFFVSYNI